MKLTQPSTARAFNVYISKNVMPTVTLSDVNLTSHATASGDVNIMVGASTLKGAGIYYLGLEPISKYISSSSVFFVNILMLVRFID